jgi:hypothetical protein
MSRNHLPPTTTSYIHLRPEIKNKLDFYDNHHKKKSRPYYKFQAGSTTTFSGYTNIANLREKAGNYQQQERTSKYNIDVSKFFANNRKYPGTNNYMPPLMNDDMFQQPPKKIRRAVAHAELFKNRTSSNIYDINNYNAHNNNTKSSFTMSNINGLILSDSMCKHIRAEKLSSKQIHVKLSFESGCTCIRMMQFLQEQANANDNDIFEANFIVYSLCTNDVANIGATAAITQCREFINRTRKLFPKLKTIGWIALSPRLKPSRLFDSEGIRIHYRYFNQLLEELGKELNFDIVYGNLQTQHLHIDGLHPSISSGRNLIENALFNWFHKRIKMLIYPQQNDKPMEAATSYQNRLTSLDKNKDTIKSKFNYNKKTHYNNKKTHYNNKNDNLNHSNKNDNRNYYNKNDNRNYDDNRKNYIKENNYNDNNKHIQLNTYRQKKQIFNHNNNNDNINTVNDKYYKPTTAKTLYLPGKTLIPHYPHFLRHKEEFFEKSKYQMSLRIKKMTSFF